MPVNNILAVTAVTWPARILFLGPVLVDGKYWPHWTKRQKPSILPHNLFENAFEKSLCQESKCSEIIASFRQTIASKKQVLETFALNATFCVTTQLFQNTVCAVKQQ